MVKKILGERLLVCTASEDPRAPRGRAYCEAVRGRAYCEALRGSGWRGKVEWFESQNKGRAFFVADHGSPEAVALMD
jgi:hypothetical protein